MTFLIAPAAFLLLFIVAAAASKIPAVIVFGDSSVDAGNNNGISTVLKSNFRPYGRDFFGGRPTGRFSNGRIPPDFISEAFGLRPFVPAYLDPQYNVSDFAQGVCFASAGTGFDNATSNVLAVPNCRNLYETTLTYHCLREDEKLPFDDAIQFIEQCEKDGARVLVHCMWGKNRSPAVVMAYLMKSKNWRLADCYQWVKERRPLVDVNQGVYQQLQEYEQMIFGSSDQSFPSSSSTNILDRFEVLKLHSSSNS